MQAKKEPDSTGGCEPGSCHQTRKRCRLFFTLEGAKRTSIYFIGSIDGTGETSERLRVLEEKTGNEGEIALVFRFLGFEAYGA